MKKQLLFVFALLSCGALSAQVYLTENFDGSGTALPANWAVETADATSDGWLRNTAANLASTYWGYPDNGGKIMSTNDDGCDCDKSADRLIFPSVNLGTATAPFLVFDQYFFAQTYQSATESGSVEVSTNGGSTWTSVADIPGNTIGAWQTVAFSLAAYAGDSDVLVSVVYNDDGGWMFGFGMDNASIQEQPQGLNVAVTTFDGAPLIDAIPALSIASKVVTGRDIYFQIGLANNNGTTINSCDITVSNGTNSITQSVTGLNLNWLGTTFVVLDDAIAALAGNNNFSVTLSNINGGNDDDATDNSMSGVSVEGVSLDPTHGVLIEEATGTWCGWCVRGTVMLGYMQENYPDNFVGVAVHNADPMVLAEYDTWIGGQINGYPSIVVNRDGTVYDPLDMENMTVEYASEAPAATISASHSLSGNTLTVNVDATYNQNLSGNYRLNVILVEDHLTGTGTTWGQSNYYSGGGNGPMGGYEEESGTVTGLYYDHVGRALLGGTDGLAGSLPANGTSGSTYSHTFTTTMNSAWNPGWMHVVAVMTAPDGSVVNVTKAEQPIQVNEAATLDNSLIIFPNPSNGVINLQANMKNASRANVRVYSATGELVMNRQIQDIRFSNALDIQNFGAGLYTIVVEADGFSATRRVTVTK